MADRLPTDPVVLSPRTASSAGFTLVELLIVVLILGIVGGFTVRALVQGYRTSADVQGRLDTHAALQDVQIDVTRRLRAACPVIAISGDETTVQVRHSNGDVEKSRFYLTAADELREDRDRWDGAAWQHLSDQLIAVGIDNDVTILPVFEGLDEDGFTAANLVDLRAIRTQLRRVGADGDQVLVTTTVSLRNGDSPCPYAP